jgi:hypothetical protein
VDHSIYQAALEGLELQKQRIEDQIKQVKSLLAGKTKTAKAAPAAAKGEVEHKKRRKLSAVARKRIAEAQKKRWAAFRKAQPTEAS